MYIPNPFRVENAEKLTAFIRANSFAIVVTRDEAGSFASHLPMLYEPDAGPHGTLIAHMARANPQWQHFSSGEEILVIFQGPHAYISPAWYESQPAVPTWNYVAVHAYGVPRLITDPAQVVSVLEAMTSHYETGRAEPWRMEQLPGEYVEGMLKGLVAFEVAVTRMEGKFKLGQNRSAADLKGVCAELETAEDSAERGLAEMMREECLK